MANYFENLHKVVATSITEIYHNTSGMGRVVWLKNPTSNTDTFYLGEADVTAPASADATDGFELAPGEAIPVTFAPGAKIFGIANTAGTQKIHVLTAMSA